MKQLRRAEITFDGLNVEKAVNMLVKQNIEVYCVHRLPNRRCMIAVPAAISGQVVALLQQKCYNNIQVKLCGIDGAMNTCRRHIALALIVVLLFPALLLLSNFCWKVDIVADNNTEEVAQVLREQGVYVGGWLANINFDKVENVLAAHFDSVYAIVNRRGSAVYVQLLARDTGLPQVDYTKRYDIVATMDGVVSRITVVQGTALVKKGDTVKKGQVLIQGKRTFADGTTEDVRAIGEVYAEVSAEGYCQYTGTVTQLVDSGKTFSYVTVNMSQATSSAPDIPFEHWRTEQRTVVLYPLAVKLIYYTVYEQVNSVTPVSFEQDKQHLTELARQKAQDKASWTATSEKVEVLEGKGVKVTLCGTVSITSDNLSTGGTEQ